MVVRGKGKQKAIQAADSGASKGKDEQQGARDIIKRLRKGQDFKPLSKEVKELVEKRPSAISLLCQAKVELAVAVEGLMSSKALEFEHRTWQLRSSERDHLKDALECSKRGAEEYASLLCAKFYTKLMDVLSPGFERLRLPNPEELADPGTELLEQGASLCEFETWGKDKDKDKDKAPEKPSYSREFKLDMVLELERVRLNPNNKRRAADPAAHDVADGIFHSGLLYESQKAHLRKVLSKRQNQAFQHAENTRLSPQQLMQLAGVGRGSPSWDELQALDLAKEEHTDKLSRAEELRKRQETKKGTDAQMRADWMEEVVAYVQHTIAKHTDNEARLAALHDLTRLPLEELVKCSEACADKDPDGQREKRRTAQVLRSLIPAKGAVSYSAQVLLETDAVVPEAEVPARQKEETICRLAKGDVIPVEELRSIGIDPSILIAEVWDGTWAMWTGQVPSDMSPLSSIAALNDYFKSAESPEYKLVPLDEPSDGLGEVIRKFVHSKVSDDTGSILTGDQDIVSAGRDLLLKILTKKTVHAADWLPEMTAACMDKLAGNACHLVLSPEEVMPDLRPPLDFEYQHTVTVTEVAALHDRPMDQILRTRGQVSVSFWEQLREVTHELSQEQLQQLFEMYSKALNPDNYEFRLESRLEGRTMTAEDFAPAQTSGEPNGHCQVGSDSDVTDDMSSRYPRSMKESIEAWWEVAEQRFTTEQLREALLEEIRLAALTLRESAKFSVGLASAISAHIHASLISNANLPGSRQFANQSMHLEHARLLEVEPLRALLSFLWIQLGLRWEILPCNQKAAELSLGHTRSFFEFLGDGTVRFAALSLRHLACEQKSGQAGEAAQKAAEEATEEQKQAKPDGQEAMPQDQHSAEQQSRSQLHLQQHKGQMLLQHVNTGCSAHGKLEVTDDYIRYFVERVFAPAESAEAEQEVEDPEQQQIEQRSTALEYQSALQNSIAEAVAIAHKVGEVCGRLVYAIDACNPKQFLPHCPVDSAAVQMIYTSLNTSVGPRGSEAVLKAVSRAGARYVANIASVSCAIRAVDIKGLQQRRTKQLVAGFRGFHMDTLVNMGHVHAREIEDIVRRDELYNGTLTHMEEAAEGLSDELQYQYNSLVKEQGEQEERKVTAGHDQAPMAAVCSLNGIQQHVISHIPDQAVVDMNDRTQDALDTAVAAAVQSICRLMLQMDMLVVQIASYHVCATDFRCESAESLVFEHHMILLRKRLVDAARRNKELTQKEAADKTMQELLAVEEQSKTHIAEGALKKQKKKKKGGKHRGEKQEEAGLLLQQDQNTIAEDWENEVPPPPGLQNGNEASTRSPSPGMSASVKEDDYRRTLSDAYQEEDWSTVDKKKDRKVKAVTKPGEATAAAAAAASPPSAWDTPDDGWEDASAVMDVKKSPPGLPAKGDASSSASDQNGHEPATSTARSDLDIQCDKCGKWGHPASKCTEEFCDRCQQKGHSIKNCKQRHQRDSARAVSEQERSREAQLAEQQKHHTNATCYKCGVLGHLARDCSMQSPNTQCYNCGHMGHIASACPNPPAREHQARVKVLPIPSKTAPLTVSRRHADSKPSQSASTSQAGPTEQDESQRGRGGRQSSREQQFDNSGATLPLPRSTKRGQGHRHAQQEQAADFPSLSNSLPPGLPVPPTDARPGASQPPPPQPVSTWGPAHVAGQRDPKVGKPDPKSHRPTTPGWGQSESIQDQVASVSWTGQDDDADDDDYHSVSSSSIHQSPHRLGAPTDTLHPAWGPQSAGIRPNSARSLGLTDSSGASISGHGHHALAPSMLQPGMNASHQGWTAPGAAFGPHSSDPQLPSRLHQQLASASDPVISPAFAPRSAAARPYQPGFDPADPLKQFNRQENQLVQEAVAPPAPAPAPAGYDSDTDFMTNLLNENQMDNMPVPAIYSAAPVGAADTAYWPDPPPAGPGAMSWAARVDTSADAQQAPDQEEDDPDLQKALQASLTDDQSELKQAAYADELMRQGPEAAANGVSVVGLRNATGEYNCFLNVIIQCLWHCHDFRTQVMEWQAAAYEDNAVVTALIGLFKAFAEREKSKAASQAVDPTQLRVALGNLEGDKFRVGQMGDAAEVLAALYEKLAVVAGKAGKPTLLDDNFGLHVKENVHCQACSKDTHQHDYVQYFFNVMSTSIGFQGILAPDQSLGQHLKDIEDQSQKSCDSDKGGCNVMNSVQHILLSAPPRVFTMQLAWQSNNESAADIRSAMDGMTQELDLGDVYLHVPQHKHIYHIRSMVCYYGQHYLAFVLMPDNVWFMFDDASMQRVGNWASVIGKCAAGRTQASVLFFEQK